ncbi:MAG TPA: ABC-F family ATP-binding cassette domain-containing protein [Bacteroidales bacterium]|nr:ABC-F family ATP-binding cassette domain-containing protein [Bacteroidales bacterium]
MNYLLAENLKKSFGEKLLFKNLTFGIDAGQKIAMIAKNGSGKTTLLNMLAGIDFPEEGRVVIRKGIRVSYLQQNPELGEENTILEVVFNSENDYITAIRNYEQALIKIKLSDSSENQLLFEAASSRMDALNAWDYETKVKEILTRFQIENLLQKVSELSGGQRKKVALAKALIEEVDLLLLDEPTNHLDIEMIEWLEDYLSKQKLSLLVVTHDRYFLDNVCQEILELDNGQLYRYKGNYSYFLEKKAEREHIESLETEKSRNIYRTELEWMRRMPSARGTKSKARVDAFYDIQEKALKRTSNGAIELNVKMNRLGGKILELNNISKSFGDFKAVDDFTYTFKKGERIGIVGKNGIGKSTLLNIITGDSRADRGKISLGQTVVFGYYSQEGFLPKEDKRVIELVKDIAEEIPLGKGTMSASQFLNHFNFPPTLQYNYFSNLSGGEKRRLFLLITLIKNPNFLLLDEPTNDLDISTLQILEDFLLDFKGCLMIVSHDRFFLDKLVDHVFVFEGNGRIKDYYGNYTGYYRQKLLEESAKSQNKIEKPKREKPKDIVKKPSYKQKLEYESLENEIQSLETEKSEIINRLNSGKENMETLHELSIRFGEIEKLIDEKTIRWMDLSEIIDNSR